VLIAACTALMAASAPATVVMFSPDTASEVEEVPERLTTTVSLTLSFGPTWKVNAAFVPFSKLTPANAVDDAIWSSWEMSAVNSCWSALAAVVSSEVVLLAACVAIVFACWRIVSCWLMAP
jgi:hypothetical protein